MGKFRHWFKHCILNYHYKALFYDLFNFLQFGRKALGLNWDENTPLFMDFVHQCVFNCTSVTVLVLCSELCVIVYCLYIDSRALLAWLHFHDFSMEKYFFFLSGISTQSETVLSVARPMVLFVAVYFQVNRVRDVTVRFDRD